MAAKPLQTISGVHKLTPQEDVAVYNGKKSSRTFHIFVNSLDEPVDLYYFYDGGETLRGSIEPGSNLYVGTYLFHQWKVKRRGDGALLGLYAGQSAIVTVHKHGCSATYNAGTVDWRDVGDANTSCISTPNGPYSLRSEVQGMQIWALEHVSEEAVERLMVLVNCMLEACPVGVLQRMLKHHPSFGIFGRNNVVSDIPPHAFMRFNTNRDLDKSSRGLGATPTVPVTSCGEENLTMDDDRFYPCQSIFVHEFGHAVMNLGMPMDTRQRLQEAYEAAVNEGIYPQGTYIIVNEHEYFATATEAWFESTIRKDANGGLNTRDLVKSRDPRLASIMAEMFGDGKWRFHHNCPRPLSFHRSKSTPASHLAPKKATAQMAPGPGQQEQIKQLREQLLAQQATIVGVQHSQQQLQQQRARQQQQQRSPQTQQERQQAPHELQPPSADDLAVSKAAADCEAMHGPIGTGDPAGNSSLLSWLMPSFPCMPTFVPATPPHLATPPSQKPQLSQQEQQDQQQPLLPQSFGGGHGQDVQPIQQQQQQQSSHPESRHLHHQVEQQYRQRQQQVQQQMQEYHQQVKHMSPERQASWQQKVAKFDREQAEYERKHAEWRVKYAQWEADAAKRQAEKAEWERDLLLREQARAAWQGERAEWDRLHGAAQPPQQQQPQQPQVQGNGHSDNSSTGHIHAAEALAYHPIQGSVRPSNGHSKAPRCQGNGSKRAPNLMNIDRSASSAPNKGGQGTLQPGLRQVEPDTIAPSILMKTLAHMPLVGPCMTPRGEGYSSLGK